MTQKSNHDNQNMASQTKTRPEKNKIYHEKPEVNLSRASSQTKNT